MRKNTSFAVGAAMLVLATDIVALSGPLICTAAISCPVERCYPFAKG